MRWWWSQEPPGRGYRPGVLVWAQVRWCGAEASLNGVGPGVLVVVDGVFAPVRNTQCAGWLLGCGANWLAGGRASGLTSWLAGQRDDQLVG
eukprot:162547-Chlamydomonas_euryale.AAC.1